MTTIRIMKENIVNILPVFFLSFQTTVLPSTRAEPETKIIVLITIFPKTKSKNVENVNTVIEASK
jgi:hypothetical protein